MGGDALRSHPTHSFKWPRQESNLDLELRKLLYYPLYYEAVVLGVQRYHIFEQFLKIEPEIYALAR